MAQGEMSSREAFCTCTWVNEPAKEGRGGGDAEERRRVKSGRDASDWSKEKRTTCRSNEGFYGT